MNRRTNMPDQYSDGKSPEQRLRDRLRNSGDMKEWPATGLLETNPTRTFTNIYRSSTQQGARVSAQPLGSRPRDVGVFESDPDVFAQNYGLNKPKGLTLNGSLFRKR
jgi:hypothetical protein